MLDNQPTVAWPPTTVSWPFSDFSQIFSELLGTSKKHCLTVGRRSRDLRPLSRDRSATFSKISPNCLKRQKTLLDSQPTVAWPPTTAAWPFSDFFQKISEMLDTSKERCLTVGRQSRDLRPLSRDRSATFFKISPICLKRLKNVVWQSPNGRVTSDHCRVTVQQLFDSHPTVAWPPTTVAWPFSDFFENFPNSLKRRKNVVWQSADSRVISDHCRVTVWRLFSKFLRISFFLSFFLSSYFFVRKIILWLQNNACMASKMSMAVRIKILLFRWSRFQRILFAAD